MEHFEFGKKLLAAARQQAVKNSAAYRQLPLPTVLSNFKTA